MTDFLKIAKSIAVHFAHICAYGVKTVKDGMTVCLKFPPKVSTEICGDHIAVFIYLHCFYSTSTDLSQ